MSLSLLPALVSTWFVRLGGALDRRSAARVPLLLLGLLLARGRRTCTSWFRAADITVEYRRIYHTISACGRQADFMASRLLPSLDPVLGSGRLLFAFDDTPTARYGPQVEGAGIHHNPTPGPAGERFVYGHVWVCVAAVVHHPDWGTRALPLRAELYTRAKDIQAMAPDRRVPFRTKLEMAAGLLHWACLWRGYRHQEVWAVVDGGYSKKPFLRSARKDGVVVVGRLAKNAALRTLPDPPPLPPARRRRGRPPTYGKQRIVLRLRAGHTEGWQQVTCRQYGRDVTRTVKTFLATWRPAGGLIRVVLVKEEDGGWRAYFCTKASASVREVLEAAADRGALEETNKEVKEVWGAGQQQVRNREASIGCFNLNLWMHSLTELWAWNRPQEELVDRAASPWDSQPRRPSHADKRKAWQREVLRADIEAALAGQPNKQEIRALAERLLAMAG